MYEYCRDLLSELPFPAQACAMQTSTTIIRLMDIVGFMAVTKLIISLMATSRQITDYFTSITEYFTSVAAAKEKKSANK